MGHGPRQWSGLMGYDYTYDIHKEIERQRFRHRERDLSHLRALKSDDRSGGIVSRIMGSLKRLKPADSRRRRQIAYEAQLLTDRACRMADGTLGRIAIRDTGGVRTEVCVPR